MGIIGVIWAVVIALKIFTTLVTASWWIVIFWPIVPIVILWLLLVVAGIGVAGFQVMKGR